MAGAAYSIIDDILPGQYTVHASTAYSHRVQVDSIRIAPDSISIVDFLLIPNALDVIVLPHKWYPKFQKRQ